MSCMFLIKLNISSWVTGWAGLGGGGGSNSPAVAWLIWVGAWLAGLVGVAGRWLAGLVGVAGAWLGALVVVAGMLLGITPP